MTRFRPTRLARKAYTLVEALIAAAILVIGVAAAASLALSMVAQEEANSRVMRAINLQEQATRLYQLGLSSSTITAILPADSGVSSITFTNTTVGGSNVANLDAVICRMTFTAGSPITSAGAAQMRVNDFTVVRPSTR